MLILLASRELTIGLIGGVVLLILIAAALFFMLRNKDKKKAAEFIEGLGSAILDITFETIANANPSQDPDYTLADFEAELISNIYDKVWDFVSKEAEESAEIDVITKTILKYIDKDMVVKFIDKMFKEKDIQSKIMDHYRIGRAGIEEKAEEEDKDLEKEYSDQEQYNETVDEDKDLNPAEEKEPTEEEKAAINPPKDEEDETYDPTDDSQELIPDEEATPTIVESKDKNGNTLYYEILPNGSKKRVSKAYVEKFMK
jgi:hypothetical protein